jgi:acyl carrier protein
MDKQENIKNTILSCLSEQLGIELSDLHEEDFLKEDLHMKPTDLADFTVTLSEKGLDTSSIDFGEILTIGELIEHLTSKEEI